MIDTTEQIIHFLEPCDQVSVASKDILNRGEFVEQVVNVIRSIADTKRSCTFAIDGHWGCGKSFVLDMIEEELGLYQHPDAAGDRYLVIRYNCWQYDFYEEPAIAIIAAIRDELDKYQSIVGPLNETIQKVIDVGAKVGLTLIHKLTKIGRLTKIGSLDLVDTVRGAVQDTNEKTEQLHGYDDYYKFKKILDDTKNEIRELTEDKPIIIMVDELDRCLPEYAIKVLERLHHIFDENSNTIVVLATDQAQLSRTVQRIFGIKENAQDSNTTRAYLRKFLNFSISLDYGELSKSFWEKFSFILPIYNVGIEELPTDILDLPARLFAGVEIRNQERIVDQMVTLHKLTFGENGTLSVLVFELLHQFANYKKCAESLEWFTQIDHTHNHSDSQRLGNDKYTLYEELSASCVSKTNAILQNGKKYFYLLDENNPLAIALWLLACVGGPEEFPGCCGHYKLENSQKYATLVAYAKRYNKLSLILE